MINADEAHMILKETFEYLIKLREEGQKEYAHDNSNALQNFERLADRLGISREKVLMVYLEKHIDGITSYVNGHRSQRESVTGRINDAILYLILLKCMVADDERRTNSKVGQTISTAKRASIADIPSYPPSGVQ